MLFEDTIAVIVPMFQVGYLSGKQAGGKVCALNDAEEFSCKLETSEELRERERNGKK